MQIVIPSRFEIILKQKQNLYSEVIRLTSDFSELLSQNKLEFFPEYTDHGLSHIQSVLDTAEKIISDDSYEILTPEDIYILISSILIHDFAMHLDKYGLWSLLSNDIFNGEVIGKIKDKPWSEKWNDFKQRVKKFEESEWKNFFGSYIKVDLPKIGDDNLNDNQKILLGDFLRFHHAEIAQIIPSFGIPNKDLSLKVFSDEYTSLNQLSGFIAKSHNYDLRKMVDLLGGEQKARIHINSHPAFLMGVLRIADYLQFTRTRTPKILFQLKGTGMCSPISMQEWKKHLSILSCNQEHSDSELIFVEAFPNDVQTLENIEKLLKGFQSELDSFWAVTGEVYSRYTNLANLAISIRRVKSNIDNPSAYVEMNNKMFYPENLSIKSDNKKVLPLLISPLYGDYPQIGIRELIQNSVDACNERYSVEINQEVNLENIPYSIDIYINIDKNTFTIKDEGMGMDIDTVKDYFLKIGSSYRYSEVWKSTHMNEDKAFIPRTGKFGIGMLAGFLIGDEISVLTRKENSSIDRAISFDYSLDIEKIQINYVNSKDIGTCITIKSNKEKINKILNSLDYEKIKNDVYYRNRNYISSFWYFLDTPKVNIFKIENNQSIAINNPEIIKKESLYNEEKSVMNTTLESFLWKPLSSNHYYKVQNQRSALFCNGIEIKNFNLPRISIDFNNSLFTFRFHRIYITDNNGLFPLNLTRTNLLTNNFYEIEKLKESVLLFYFEYINKLYSNYSWGRDSILEFIKNYNLIDGVFGSLLPFIFMNNGIYPLSDDSLDETYVFFDFITESQKRGLIYRKELFPILEKNNVGYGCSLDTYKDASTTIKVIFEFILKLKEKNGHYLYFSHNFKEERFSKINVNSENWLFIKKFDFNKLDKLDIERFDYFEEIIIDEINSEWLVFYPSRNRNSIPDFGLEIISSSDKNNMYMFVVSKFENNNSSEFSELWKTHIKEII